MKNLYKYLQNVLEGGASGHMAHPYDYTDFTLRDLKGLVRRLFEGRIEDVTEKVDGTNIQATVNKDGEVVFIRNKGNLNSEKGGMSIRDMADKWADKPSVAKTFLQAGEIITQVFSNIPNKFFNPDPETRVIVNCECVVAGKTNIMPYASDAVDFHDLWIYKFNGTEWEQDEVTKKGLEIVAKACEEIDNAQVTPQIIIKTIESSKQKIVDYIKQLDKLFKQEGLKEYSTIDDWKKVRFRKECEDSHEWILNGDGIDVLYNRWFNDDKSTNIKVIKQMYPDNVDELTSLDKKGKKDIVKNVMEPLDTFFIKMGNDVLELCDGIINSGREGEVVEILKKDLEEVVKDVETNGSEESKTKLLNQLKRLEAGDNKVQALEGIVFRYNGKLMKVTSNFAPINQILGSIKFSK
jgi:hypothetical protein